MLSRIGVACAHAIFWSIVSPLAVRTGLKQVAGLQNNWITVTLVIFGAMGILGSLAFSWFYNKDPYKFTDFVLWGIFGCLMLLQVAACCYLTIILLCALWGMVFTASNVVLQAETINNSPIEATAVSMSIFSGIFNLGIACGTYIGGQVCTRLFYVVHRLCRSRTGIYNIYLLEQDYQKENERKGSLLLVIF